MFSFFFSEVMWLDMVDCVMWSFLVVWVMFLSEVV